MVYIRLNNDSPEVEFQDNINIHRTFGKFVWLKDEKGNIVPLTSDGVPFKPLDTRQIYTIEFQSFGFETKLKKYKKHKKNKSKKSKKKKKDNQTLLFFSLLSQLLFNCFSCGTPQTEDSFELLTKNERSNILLHC